MEEIISILVELKEDKPHLVITDNLIKQYIEDNIDLLVEEIKEEVK